MAATAALMALLTGCAAQTAPPPAEVVEQAADYPSYADLGELFAKADLIVEATIEHGAKAGLLGADAPPADDPRLNPTAGTGKGQNAEPAPVVVTVYQAKVAKVYKGEAKAGSAVAVKQTGGTLNGTTFRDPETRDLHQGGRYILFLTTFPDVPASLLNPDQGQYPLAADGTLSRVGDTAPSFTVADLERLAGKQT